VTSTCMQMLGGAGAAGGGGGGGVCMRGWGE
jgi:hypothetical protein